jgi:hypothetical protein
VSNQVIGELVARKASKKDSSSRVTIITKEILLGLAQGQKMILGFRYHGADYEVVFYANRKTGTTIKTTSWPKDLPTLTIGKSLTLNNVSVTFI